MEISANKDKEFACFYSPVLNAAFNGEYVESQTQSYLLEDVAASTCRFLVQWLYTQCFDVCHAGLEPSVTNIDSNSIKAMISSDTTHEVEEKRKASAGLAKQVIQKKDAQQDASEEEPGDDVYHQELEFIKLWILADALLIRPLQNHIVEVLEAIWDDPRSGDPVWTDFIPYVYDNTSEESPLRHLFIDKIAYDWGSSDILEHHAEALPRELLLDLFSIFSAAISADTQTNARGQICKKMDVKGKQMYTCKRVWRNYFVFEDE